VPSSPITKVLEHLRKTMLLREEDHLSDGQLLDRFLKKRDDADDAAFAALVRRHGPMVWGVCLRIVGHTDDAEDAFQATFLILVRKAAAIKPRDAVGNWLYGVASHASLKARTASARVRAKEKQVTSMPEPAKDQRDDREELQRLLDQALGVLPDKYRLPVVLCDLEGRTRKEVAAQLKIPEGTLSSRLATAHQMLAKRLARRGLVVSGGSLAALFAQNAASASVPPAVVSSTIKTAILVAASKWAVAGVASTKVAALTEGVMKAMLLTKLKVATATVLIISLLAVAGTLISGHISAAQQGQAENVADGGRKGDSNGLGAGAVEKERDFKKQPEELDNELMTKAAQEVSTTPGAPEKKLTVASSDQKAFQGRWRLLQGRGRIAEDEPNWHFEEGKKIWFGYFVAVASPKDFKRGRTATYKLDPSQHPKTIDVTLEDGKEVRGIYLLADDALIICLSKAGAARPSAFTAGTEAGEELLLFQREEPKAKKSK
jgi:RNA polymerase sigma factor (sigma-70 family)